MTTIITHLAENHGKVICPMVAKLKKRKNKSKQRKTNKSFCPVCKICVGSAKSDNKTYQYYLSKTIKCRITTF